MEKYYLCKVTIVGAIEANETVSFRKEILFYVEGHNKLEAESRVRKHLGETILRDTVHLRLKGISTRIIRDKKPANEILIENGLRWSDGYDEGLVDIRMRDFVVFTHVVDFFRKYSYLMDVLVTARTARSAFIQAEDCLYGRKLRYHEDSYHATCTDRPEAVKEAAALPDFTKDGKVIRTAEGPTQGKIDIRTRPSGS